MQPVLSRLALKYLFTALLCICITISLLLEADAYVLSGPHILDLMIKKLGRTKRLQVNQTLIVYPTTPNIQTDIQPDIQKDPVELTETLSYRFPEHFRSDIITKDSHEIHIVDSGEWLTVRDEKIVSTTQSIFYIYKDLLLYRSRILLGQQLPLHGIELSVSSLGRFEGRIVYIIGAKYPDDSVSQIWIDKHSFMPLRLIIVSKDDNNLTQYTEYRYLNWHKTDGTWYPMQIELYNGGNLARMIKVEEVKAVSSFPDNFFDTAHLKSEYQPIVPDIIDSNDTDDLNEIKKTIEDFKKIFEE
jgi:outer membrane lipoprotein-sorting protein